MLPALSIASVILPFPPILLYQSFFTQSLLNSLFIRFLAVISAHQHPKFLSAGNHKKCYLLVLCEVCGVFIVTSLKKCE